MAQLKGTQNNKTKEVIELCYEDRRVPKDFKDTTEAGASLITTIIPIITGFYKDVKFYHNWFSYKSFK